MADYSLQAIIDSPGCSKTPDSLVNFTLECLNLGFMGSYKKSMKLFHVCY